MVSNTQEQISLLGKIVIHWRTGSSLLWAQTTMDMVIHSCIQSEMTGDGSRCKNFIYFPAVQESGLSLWQWKELEMGWGGTPGAWKELMDMPESRKVSGNVSPHSWVYYGVLHKVLPLVNNCTCCVVNGGIKFRHRHFSSGLLICRNKALYPSGPSLLRSSVYSGAL